MNSAIPIASTRPSRKKHNTQVYQYGEAEWGMSCTCGIALVDLTQEQADEFAVTHTRPDFVDPRDSQPEVLYTSKGDEVQVALTDAEARQILRAEIERRFTTGRPASNFVVSITERFEQKGNWSSGQRPWAHKIANEIKDRTDNPPERKLSTEVFPELVDMMQSAADKLKHPRIVVQLDAGTIRLSVAGERAQVPGSVNVTSDGAYEDRTWYGRIHLDGRFEQSRRGAPDWIIGALAEFNENPAEAASLQGQRYGSCCFCRRELTTNESLAVGYGPICADHYGLPWGEID